MGYVSFDAISSITDPWNRRQLRIKLLGECRMIAVKHIVDDLKDAGYRQVDLASQLGWSPETVSRAFTGKRPFPTENYLQIANLLHKSIHELLFGDPGTILLPKPLSVSMADICGMPKEQKSALRQYVKKVWDVPENTVHYQTTPDWLFNARLEELAESRFISMRNLFSTRQSDEDLLQAPINDFLSINLSTRTPEGKQSDTVPFLTTFMEYCLELADTVSADFLLNPCYIDTADKIMFEKPTGTKKVWTELTDAAAKYVLRVYLRLNRDLQNNFWADLYGKSLIDF